MSETPLTELPDGSGCCTATILSHEEAMALPLSKRPLNYRMPGDLYHAVWEAVGAASMCWDPRPDNCVFDNSAAEKVAMDLCFKIAEELDKQADLGLIHTILDNHESQIIRNTKDGYPEGREPRDLTLAERVQALCTYASDWKKWCEEKENTHPHTLTIHDPRPGEAAHALGHGYRKMKNGEITQAGDEVWTGKEWEQADTGCPVIDDICRRKIEVDPPPQSASMPTG